MRKYIKACVLFVCALAFSAPARADDCTLREFASLDLTTSDGGGPVVEAEIAGRSLRLLIDTAGIYSALKKDVADQLHLSLHDIKNGEEIYAFDGTQIKKYIDVSNFELGPIKLDTMAMMYSQGNIPNDIDGTIAADFLNRFDVDFDFGAKKLNLFSPDHCPGKAVYWADSYVDVPFKNESDHIAVSMSLDGHDTSAVIDTGASVTSLSESSALNLYGLDDSTQGMEAVKHEKTGEIAGYKYHFKSLSLNGVTINNPLIYIWPDLAGRSFRKNHDGKLDRDSVYGDQLQEPKVILGMNVLSKLHLFISYKERKLYLTAADAHRKAP